MRTEYDIQITDNRGKTTHSVYPKRYAEEKANALREFYAKKDGFKVEFFKVLYNGSSLCKAEKIW